MAIPRMIVARSNESIRRGSRRWRASRRRISGAIASRWIDLVEEELGALARDEKPWIRELTGRLVTFCRVADRAPDVLFAWSLR